MLNLESQLNSLWKLFNSGNGTHGQRGHGNGNHRYAPRKVEALADEVIVDVACRFGHSLAVTSTGSIYTWGADDGGDNADDDLLPTLLLDLSSKGVISVSAGW